MRVGFSSRSFINVLNLYSGIEAKHLSKLGKKVKYRAKARILYT